MDRKSFTQQLALLGICPLMIQHVSGTVPVADPNNYDQMIRLLKQFLIRFGTHCKFEGSPVHNFLVCNIRMIENLAV